MPRLSAAERLRLQQLRLQAWADARDGSGENTSSPACPTPSTSTPPAQWTLTQGYELSDWQMHATKAWFNAGRKGTVKVVTGAGKTVLALAIAEALQRTADPELRVAIVVPTIVLMHQWRDEILEHSNLPESWIACLGGGHSGEFEPARVLVAVLASARKELPELVHKAGISGHLLLIADECHRAGAPEMARVLEASRAYSLGLSATPERDDWQEGEDSVGGPADYDGSQLGRELGPLVYEMTVAQAVAQGILPRFEIAHYGLALTPGERERYEKLSRAIQEAATELHDAFARRRSSGKGGFHAWCRQVAKRPGASLAGLAARFVNDSARRKLLLYSAEMRRTATIALLKTALAAEPSTRAILFHESIDEVVRLYDALVGETLPAVMEHSQLPEELRQASLDLFRKGEARIIASVKSLIEGFNVPETDLGIIVASSSSPRQRVQSIGRTLRTHRNSAGKEKVARVCVLYVRDTVDEYIYERKDWSEFLGVERNVYYIWNLGGEPILQEGPPREAIPEEGEIDFARLATGERYPGRYEGAEYSCDTHGNVSTLDGVMVRNPQGVAEIVTSLKGGAGRFRVTSSKRGILARVPDGDEWATLYGGCLAEPLRLVPEESIRGPAEVEVARLTVGASYPGPTTPAQEMFFRQKRGGVIAKRVPGGEVFASGEGAEQLLTALRAVAQRSGPVGRFMVNDLGHAFWFEGGVARFLAALSSKLGFPPDKQADDPRRGSP